MMTRCLRIIFPLLAAAVSSVSFGAEAPLPSLKNLDQLTKQWINLRGTLAEEQRVWSSRKDRWEEEITLLREESDLLQHELDQNQDLLTNTEQSRVNIIARLENTEQDLQQVDITLDQSLAKLQRVIPFVPPALRQGLTDEIFFANSTLTPSKKAQQVVAFLSILEELNNNFHVIRETIEIGSVRRQVDVFYVGLSQAFAVSPADDWSAIGVPTEQGWKWAEGEIDPTQVRKIIEVNQGEAISTLLNLPLGISGEDLP